MWQNNTWVILKLMILLTMHVNIQKIQFVLQTSKYIIDTFFFFFSLNPFNCTK